MKLSRQSDIFEINQFFWKLFGIWPGKTPAAYYKYFSFGFIVALTIFYNVLLTLNLVYTPRNLEAFIQEVIFFFTEVAVMAKVATLLKMREKIAKLMIFMDCEEFQVTDDYGKDVIKKSDVKYKTGWKLLAIVSNFSYFTFTVFPVMAHLILKKNLELPIANYYFLTPEVKENYFAYCYIYQSVGIFVHMMYNVNVDSFIAGMMLVAIAQLKVLNHNFTQLKLDIDGSVDAYRKNAIMISKLNKLLHHYDLIVKYCANVQEIISMVMFVQFCMASAIICVSMFGLLMVSSMNVLYGMLSYLFAMTMEIFVPGWLGTQLGYESRELVNAAYNSDWIPQSESYKRSLRLFIGRANAPIVITGLKMFPLALGTFISIMKMAYSFFALLRNVQDRGV